MSIRKSGRRWSYCTSEHMCCRGLHIRIFNLLRVDVLSPILLQDLLFFDRNIFDKRSSTEIRDFFKRQRFPLHMLHFVDGLGVVIIIIIITECSGLPAFDSGEERCKAELTVHLFESSCNGKISPRENVEIQVVIFVGIWEDVDVTMSQILMGLLPGAENVVKRIHLLGDFRDGSGQERLLKIDDVVNQCQSIPRYNLRHLVIRIVVPGRVSQMLRHVNVL